MVQRLASPRALALLLLLAVAGAAATEGSHVLDLTDATFQGALDSHPLAVVEFYAPWCGHCKKLAPEWERLADALEPRRSDVAIAKLDATIEKATADRFGVNSYPTILAFKGNRAAKYTGPLQKNELLGWVNTLANTRVVKEVTTAAEARSAIRGSTVAVVGFVETDAELAALELLGFELNPRSNQQYAVTTPVVALRNPHAEAAAAEFGLSGVPGVALVRAFEFEEPTVAFSGDDWLTALPEWVRANSVPALLIASKETEPLFFNNAAPGSGLLVVFTRPEDADIRRAARGLATAAASDPLLKGVQVIAANRDDYGSALGGQGFNFQATDFPVAGLLQFGQSESDDAYFRLDAPLTDETLRDFVRRWREGSLARIGDAVVAVTSATFESVVLDPAKTVLVEFYAPWCGHCQRLEPTYKQLAQRFVDDEGVVIAKIDATAHSHPSVEVRSYPTIYLFPKGQKDQPIKYDGQRTLDAFAQFVQSHA